MKSKAAKCLALLISFALVFSFAGCGNNGKDETTAPATTAEKTTVEQTTAEVPTAAGSLLSEAQIRLALGASQSAWDGKTASLTDEMKATVSMYYKTQGNPVQFRENGFYFVTDETATVSSETATSSAESTTAKPVNAVPSTKTEILAAYTAVMNKAKTDKPGYTKSMYQALPDTEKEEYKDNTTIKLLMNVLYGLNVMTKKEKAQEKSVVYEKGNAEKMKADFPITESDKGCMLTDTNAIKSAKCESLSNGNYKITIVLNNETDPERFRDGMDKAPSNSGNMFVIFSQSDVKPYLEKGVVKAVAKDTRLTMIFHDCKAELEYNPKTSQIATLDQVTHTSLDMGGKVLGKDYAVKTELDMYYSASNFQY